MEVQGILGEGLLYVVVEGTMITNFFIEA